MTWAPLTDNNGKIRGIKDAHTGQRIVRWDGMTDPLTDWGQANARMVLAAPDMLIVLEELDECAAYWSEYDVPLGLHDRIKAAIAKARGENV